MNNRMAKKLTLKTEITLHEKVDMSMLKRLISSSIDENKRKLLEMYYSRRNDVGVIPVEYAYSKNVLEKGRLYAKNGLSLQSFSKEMRCALSKDIYYDIDMVNADPVLIVQYCKKNNIECKKLDYYINNREKVFSLIQKKHKIDRDAAKALMLRLCFVGGYKIDIYNDETERSEEIEPEDKIGYLLEIKEELSSIAKKVCELEVETTKLVEKDPNKLHKKSSVLAITAHVLENQCLMEMYNFFSSRKYICGVLCFDGIMVEKQSVNAIQLDKILRQCEKYVLQKTGYNIILSEKPMNTPLTVELPLHSKFVDNDLDCCKKLLEIEGKHKFKFCKDILYIFNEVTGMYDTQIETLNYYLIKNKEYLYIQIGKKCVSYGEQNSLMRSIIPLIKTLTVDNDWLTKTENTSLGHLLFIDGIYNMKTSTFTDGFNPEIVFHIRVPHNFPKRSRREINAAREISFDRVFENPKPIIYALSRALAGDVQYKKFYLCPGKSNSGKSYLKKMLTIAFGDVIGDFNAESLAYSSNLDTKDEAAKLRWALLVRFSRILISNEINMKKSLDANAIKKHSSGGDRLIARTHNREEMCFTPHYTIFCMLNDIPKIEPMDDGILNRLEYIEFPYVFTSEKEVTQKDYNREKDMKLDDKISKQSFINGFIHIILDAYKDFLENGMPEFDQTVKHKWTLDGKQNSEIVELLQDYYVITKDQKDMVTVADLNRFKENHRNVFQTISAHRFTEICTEIGLEQKRNKNARYWVGIRVKTDIDLEG